MDYMHEDELPPMADEDYAAWFAESWIPDGVGCRVGPVVDPNGRFPRTLGGEGGIRTHVTA